jgi:hypothetical protein
VSLEFAESLGSVESLGWVESILWLLFYPPKVAVFVWIGYLINRGDFM